MPFDREHGLLTWGGTLPGQETWVSSIRMAETEATFPDPTNDAAGWDMPALLDHYQSVIHAHHTSSNAMVHANCKVEWVKFNRVDINGHYIDQTTYRADFAPAGGSRSGNQHPNQVAMVVTWTTPVSRGPASRGRLFVPLPALAIAADGRISASDAMDAAIAYKGFVEALSDVPGIDLSQSPNTVVMSQVGTAERTHRITGVRVGRVLDTQRRRRANMVEDYQLQPVDLGTF